MARIRGANLLDAVAFVADAYGPDAPAKVVLTLPGPAREVFSRSIRSIAWYDLDLFVAFLAAARDAFAPGDEDFFRRQGFYAAQRQKSGLLGSMVATSQLRRRMAPTVWRMFYDTGRLVVVAGADAASDAGQIHGFPTTPELCQRFRGIWEGMAAEPGVRATAVEPKCVLRGDEYCEFRVRAEPAGP